MNKDYYIKQFKKYIDPLFSYYQQNPSSLFFLNHGTAYCDKANGSESFSRPLWGLGPYLIEEIKKESTEASQWLQVIKKGLIEGTDPHHPSYWGSLKKGEMSQHYVEMAAIAYFLILLKKPFWEKLSNKEQNNIYQWLNQINEDDKNLADNNWRWFRVLINSFFTLTQQKYSQKQVNYDLERIDQMYLGEGWYEDGHHNQRDYYIPMAMHFYGLIFTSLFPQNPRSKTYKKRAKLFMPFFISWISERGEALPFGRSLTYRFAQVAFLSSYIIAGVCDQDFTLGELNGIISRNLRYWEHEKILNEHLLSVGYTYPNLSMAESYNGVGSPYWAFKTFVILGLKEDHPFFKAEERPLPLQKEKRIQKHSHLFCLRSQEGDVHALCGGQYADFKPKNVNEKYAKFFYSSAFGFNITQYKAGSLEYYATDSVLSLSFDGINWNHRDRTVEHQQNDQGLCSTWLIDSPLSYKARVRTLLLPLSDKDHLRIHKITNSKAMEFIEGGVSVPFSFKREKEIIASSEEKKFSSITGAVCKNERRFFKGSIRALNYKGQGEILHSGVNSNIVHPHSCTPQIKGYLQEGEHLIISYATHQVSSEKDKLKELPPPFITLKDHKLRITQYGQSKIIDLSQWEM